MLRNLGTKHQVAPMKCPSVPPLTNEALTVIGGALHIVWVIHVSPISKNGMPRTC